MHCEKRKKKKCHADDHTTVYSDVHSSIKTLQDTQHRLLRTNRHSFQTDSILSAAFPIVTYHSRFFALLFISNKQQTAIIMPVPLINWPSDKFDSCIFDLGRTLDSCGFFSWRVSSTFPQHSRWVSDSWNSHYMRKNMNTCSQAPIFCWQHMPVPPQQQQIGASPEKKKTTTC